jgi:hypothetical protein
VHTITLVKLALRDTCADFPSVKTVEEAETAFTIEELRINILDLLQEKLTPEQQQMITDELLKEELKKNNLFSITMEIDERLTDVYLVDKTSAI